MPKRPFFWPSEEDRLQRLEKYQRRLALQQAPKKKKKLSTTIPKDPCKVCGLFRKVKSPKMEVTGKGKLKVIGVGESQGKHEDLKGRQFVGDAGKELEQGLFEAAEVDLYKDLWLVNAVRCRTAEGNRNRTPTPQEILYCSKSTWQMVAAKKPKVVILFGNVPLKSYMIDRYNKELKIGKFRGIPMYDRDMDCWVVTINHPSYIMRQETKRVYRDLWLRDLSLIFNKLLHKKTPDYGSIEDERKRITLLHNEGDVESLLRKIKDEKPLFTHDLETTGIKPQRPGHKIVAVGVSTSPTEGFGFALNNKRLIKLFCSILENPDIPKTGQNIKYETVWEKVLWGTDTVGWIWDTMIVTHILDCRQKITGLLFQVGTRYGDWYFKEEADPWLKSPKKGGNEFNLALEAPIDVLMRRAGSDAMYEHRLALDQMKELRVINNHSKDPRFKAADLFHRGSLALADSEMAGFRIDHDYIIRTITKVNKRVDKVKKRMLASRYGQFYKRATSKDLNPGSDAQLQKLLFTQTKLKPIAFTKSEKPQPSVDKKALKELQKKHADNKELVRFLEDIMLYRKLTDINSTYFNGYLREIVNSTIHPHINLHIPRSYRSSGSDPNIQNVPKRDEESMKMVRRAFLPHPGQRILGVDYAALEVTIAACYSRDKVLCRYIIEDGDMHRDEALDLYLLNGDQLTKKLRYFAKNCWVFPQFYGSWWKACAFNLWYEALEETLADGTPFLEHMRSQGFKNLDAYEEYVEAHEVKYWKKYSGYAAWKEDWLEQYDRTGYVPMFHGFRRTGALVRNKVLNTSIQGTAFHLVLESYIEINELLKERDAQSKLIGEIHDEILSSVQPGEEFEVANIHRTIMTEVVPQQNPWVIVPMRVEMEMTGIDKPWSTTKNLPHDYGLTN